MDDLIKQLTEYGADTPGAMGRFLDDVDLYKTCFAMFLADESFAQLDAAIAQADYAKAFEYAHTLKGVAGNMGLTPLYQVICHIVEALRSADYAPLSADQAELHRQLDTLSRFPA
ncbi:MAG: Hpt domain-containing protein [Clostridia bacterium]